MKDSIVRPRMTAANRDTLMTMADSLSDDRQEGIKLVIELAERSGVHKADCILATQNADRLQSKVCELSEAHAIAENSRLNALSQVKKMKSQFKWYFMAGFGLALIISSAVNHFLL
ncbi:TMhelix containing protein, partial [Vibrio phage 1.123.O._10N.286.48.F3]